MCKAEERSRMICQSSRDFTIKTRTGAFGSEMSESRGEAAFFSGSTSTPDEPEGFAGAHPNGRFVLADSVGEDDGVRTAV